MQLEEILLTTNNDDNDKTYRGAKYKKDLLFSYTTVNCTVASVHNPTFCILYAVAMHLEKKTRYDRYAPALRGRASIDESSPTARYPDGLSISSSRGRSNAQTVNPGIIRLDDFYDVNLNDSKTRVINAINMDDNKNDSCCS